MWLIPLLFIDVDTSVLYSDTKNRVWASLKFLQTMKTMSTIECCAVAACVVIEDCVVGANVRVRHPITISRSVIFDDVCIDSDADLRDFIVTPECAVDCRYPPPMTRGGL